MKTMPRIAIPAALCVMLMLHGQPTVAQQGDHALPTTERLFGLAKVWQEISRHSVAFAHRNDCDWDSLYRANIPLVIKSASDYEYYRTLQRFAATLNESGTVVTFPKYIADSLTTPPVVVKEIRGRFYITNTDKQLADKLPIGSEVLRINGFAIRTYLDQEVIPYISASTDHGRMAVALEVMLEGWVNTRVLLNCLTPDGRNINEMVDRAPRGKVQWVREQTSREPMILSWVNREVALITLNRITPATIAALPDARQLTRAKVVILDLRANHTHSHSLI
jgi:carboxyl-terminal processing protease